MRKILLVQDERYLKRALQDVENLIDCQERSASEDDVVDLLAVLPMPPSAMAHLTSDEHFCESCGSANRNLLFSAESISVSGIWLLLTIGHPELLEPTAREEALSQIVNILQTRGWIENLAAVFPVFPAAQNSGESIGKQMAYLRSVHPGLPAMNALLRPYAFQTARR